MLASLPKITDLKLRGLRELIFNGEDKSETQAVREEAFASHLTRTFQQDPLPRSMDLTVYAEPKEDETGLHELLDFLRRCWSQGVELKLSYPNFRLVREPQIYRAIRKLKRDFGSPDNVRVEMVMDTDWSDSGRYLHDTRFPGGGWSGPRGLRRLVRVV